MSNPKKGEVWLIEEVPGVPENEAYHIWEYGTGRGKLWNGPTATAGRQWAKDNNIKLTGFEQQFG